MPVGTHKMENFSTATPNSYWSIGVTLCTAISVDKPILLKTLSTYFWSTDNWYGRAVVYNASGTLVASSAYGTGQPVNSGNIYHWDLTTPIILAANTEYRVGFFHGNNGNGYVGMRSSFYSANANYASTPTYALIKRLTQGMYRNTSGDGFPATVDTSNELTQGLSYDIPNLAPNAPTGLVVSNTPVPAGSPANVNWTFSDPDAGNTQSAYQIRWRRKD